MLALWLSQLGLPALTVWLTVHCAQAHGTVPQVQSRPLDGPHTVYSGKLSCPLCQPVRAGLLSALFFGHQLTLNFCIGVTIVFISMHIFFSFGKRSLPCRPVLFH